jgi:hypothetical protein
MRVYPMSVVQPLSFTISEVTGPWQFTAFVLLLAFALLKGLRRK